MSECQNRNKMQVSIIIFIQIINFLNVRRVKDSDHLVQHSHFAVGGNWDPENRMDLIKIKQWVNGSDGIKTWVSLPTVFSAQLLYYFKIISFIHYLAESFFKVGGVQTSTLNLHMRKPEIQSAYWYQIIEPSFNPGCRMVST